MEAGYDFTDNIGVVTAYNVDTNKVMWSTKVYQTVSNQSYADVYDFIEGDPKPVLIKSMNITKNKLIIINELNDRYEINPMNGKNVKDYGVKFFCLLSVIIVIILLSILFYINRNKKMISGTLFKATTNYGVNNPYYKGL